MKYVYPAIFTLDRTDENFPDGVYLIDFPDLEGCSTFGKTVKEAYEMAEDALNLALWDREENKKSLPTPSSPLDLKYGKDSFVTLISADTTAYRKLYDNRAVKKTVTIPRWLNEAALDKKINFSAVLQKGLIKALKLEDIA